MAMRQLDAFLTQVWRLWKTDSRAESIVAVAMVLGGVMLAYGPELISLVRNVFQ